MESEGRAVTAVAGSVRGIRAVSAGFGAVKRTRSDGLLDGWSAGSEGRAAGALAGGSALRRSAAFMVRGSDSVVCVFIRGIGL